MTICWSIHALEANVPRAKNKYTVQLKYNRTNNAEVLTYHSGMRTGDTRGSEQQQDVRDGRGRKKKMEDVLQMLSCFVPNGCLKNACMQSTPSAPCYHMI